jgi:hypothetical protein
VQQGKRGRCSWAEMFECWQTYAKRNPQRKNQVPLAFTKLSSWVHEQRKKFRRGILEEDRFVLLSDLGFEFEPRKAYANHVSMLRQKVNKYKDTSINVEVEASENDDDGEVDEAAEGSDSPREEEADGGDTLMEKMPKVMVALLKIFLTVERKLM